MPRTIRKIAINTGGGDAPGLNAVLRSVTLAAIERGIEVWGIKHGYRGLLENEPGGLVRLDRDAVRGIMHIGGTILGTANRGDPFHYPTQEGDKVVPKDRSGELVERFRREGFDALVAVGGDGSMRIANALLERGLPLVVGVPKTIDNDVYGTELTFGFDTAVSIATEAIDRLHSTTEAHERVMVVEVMGRHAGWIALRAGIAGGADAILMPEVPFSYEPIVEKVLQREARGRRFSIIVAAEGACPKDGDVIVRDTGDEFRRVAVLGGVAERVAKEIGARTGKETRSMVLGHLQRGGGPTTFDRLLALRFGAGAVRFLVQGCESGMVALRCHRVELIPLSETAGRTKTVDLDGDTVTTAREMGICFGDEAPGQFAPGGTAAS
ncbi:6-phosphofructokinase [Polyangium mundeleinium]|uniref:ATP-dependent 6-phosphofructokinase n=1 Tax=Polyangium mundeleinium TaxID=2995306 RepID=A0ABT5ELG3_9BACT|nr:ATP-dependent 6-phosphofructokinase [Polyangium mundeleinium]MDC0742636.1 ATP-dependent 6-phosphofructokinase [Polyangium mundeleinium]